MGSEDRGHTVYSIDLDFIHRVYRTSTIVVALFGALAWERWGWQAAAGLGFGALLSLGLIAIGEWSVRRWVNPGAQSLKQLAKVTVAKLTAGFVLLLLAFVAAQQRWINAIFLVFVLPGFALPHVILLLKLLGQKIRGMYAEADNR
jgi:hypothetical protein